MTAHESAISATQAQSGAPARTTSFSQQSEASQTAQEFISSQLQLEADAREALPYQFDTCTRPLGSIRQSLFSCLTCNPPSTDLSRPYEAAGLCYSCSISCHGEHDLVELFTRRNFTCDCGTTRLPSTSPCSLLVNTETGMRGDVHSEKPASSNTYNQNFHNRFCGCRQEYDAHSEKGTMYQCLGLATEDEGGCGEDWWHPECVVGFGRDWFTKAQEHKVDKSEPGTKLETAAEESESVTNSGLVTATTVGQTAGMLEVDTAVVAVPAVSDVEGDRAVMQAPHDPEHPVPPGFPIEDDFELFICYRCTAVHPWIKRYAGTPGFLPAVPFQSESAAVAQKDIKPISEHSSDVTATTTDDTSRKRKADDSAEDSSALTLKKTKSEDHHTDLPTSLSTLNTIPICTYDTLPPAPTEPISLFLRHNFRDHLCRCPAHFPFLTPHPALLEEEESYEPPLSAASSAASDDENNPLGSRHSAGSRSLLDRGEAALNNVDRVRAIEGVMAYNHLRDKVKDFLKPFAESGTVVGAEDVKKYFEKLRGDDEAIRRAREGRDAEEAGGEEGGRKGQAGY